VYARVEVRPFRLVLP